MPTPTATQGPPAKAAITLILSRISRTYGGYNGITSPRARQANPRPPKAAIIATCLDVKSGRRYDSDSVILITEKEI